MSSLSFLEPIISEKITSDVFEDSLAPLSLLLPNDPLFNVPCSGTKSVEPLVVEIV